MKYESFFKSRILYATQYRLSNEIINIISSYLFDEYQFTLKARSNDKIQTVDDPPEEEFFDLNVEMEIGDGINSYNMQKQWCMHNNKQPQCWVRVHWKKKLNTFVIFIKHPFNKDM